MGRWGRDFDDTRNVRRSSEHAEDPVVDMRRRRRKYPRCAASPEVLTHRLIRGPLFLRRLDRWQAKIGQGVVVGEVGDVVDVDIERPYVARQTRGRRDSVLRSRTHPLGPSGIGAASEIEAANRRADLPTRVKWVVTPEERRGPRARDAKPATGDSDPAWPRAQEKVSFSSCASRRSTERLSPSAIRSIGRSSSRARTGLFNQIGT